MKAREMIVTGKMGGKVPLYRRIPNVLGAPNIFHWPLWDAVGALGAEEATGRSGLLYIQNPGFETPGGGGADIWGGWSETAGSGALADEGTLVHGGSHAAKLTRGASNDTYITGSPSESWICPGKSYRFSFWSRGDGTNAPKAAIATSNFGAFIVDSIVGTPGTTYAKTDQDFVAPASNAAARFRLYPPNVQNAYGYFDDLTLTGPLYGGVSGGVTFGGAGVGDGKTSAAFDGNVSFINLYTLALTSFFSGEEGSMICWFKVSALGDWTDGATRYLFRFKADSNNAYTFGKDSVNNQLFWQANAGGTNRTFTQGGMTSVGWNCAGLTWSLSNNRARAFLNGLQVGTDETMGTFAGSLDPLRCVIGGDNGIAGNASARWKGSAAHAVLANYEASPAQMSLLMSV